MFTGIVEAIGIVSQIQPINGDVRIQIDTGKLVMDDVKLGDSIAVNGVCLTVVGLSDKKINADVSNETLNCSTLKYFSAGRHVNLEKALTLSTRLGGHLVSGHVDAIGEVIEMYPIGRSTFYKIKFPGDLAKYIPTKGSITVDGTSLTINKVSNCCLELNIIPQTLTETILVQYQVGTLVNLEIDLLARYVEQLLLGNDATAIKNIQKNEITESFLAKHGFK